MKSSPNFQRPTEGECPAYYFRYIDLVPEVDILTYLHTQRDWIGDWIKELETEELKYSYAPGKWSLAQMIGHVLDTERVFAYRMMAFSRGDESSLPGFDQDVYAKNTIYETLSPTELASEWLAVRTATILQSRSMNAEMTTRTGIANELPIKVVAFPYMIAGHALHHHNIAQERYLKTV